MSIGEETNILSYADAFDVSQWAVPAMQWACGAGIITGTGDGSILSSGTDHPCPGGGHAAEILPVGTVMGSDRSKEQKSSILNTQKDPAE